MAIAISAASSRHYVLKRDRERPVEEQTTFEIRPLTWAERARYIDLAQQSVGEALGFAVLCGVESFRNLTGEAGEEIECKHTKDKPGRRARLTDDMLEILGPYVLELFAEVDSVSGLGDGDRGNSASSPPTGPASDETSSSETRDESSGSASSD